MRASRAPKNDAPSQVAMADRTNTMIKGLTPILTSTKTADLPPLINGTAAAEAEVKAQKHCFCKRKLALTDMTCSKCQIRHCGAHRLPELHSCTHDFRKEGQALLTKQNPRVEGQKLERL